MIELPEKWRQAIRAEGEAAYPNECCGVLLGRLEGDELRGVEDIMRVHNAREALEQRRRFTIEPEVFLRAEKEARERNFEVLGFYHSHPDHPARPSEYDRNNALPFYSYVIVSVGKSEEKPRGETQAREKPRARELTSWRLTDDRKEFLEEQVCPEADGKEEKGLWP